MAVIRGNPVKHWIKINDQGDVFVDQNLVPGGMSAIDGYLVTGENAVVGDLQVTGDVGIGTATPDTPLEILRTTDGDALKLTINRNAGSTDISINFWDEVLSNQTAGIQSIRETTANAHSLIFSTNDGGSMTDQMTIDSDGGIHAPNMKSGTDQSDAGAAAGELYFDTNDDNTVKIGV